MASRIKIVQSNPNTTGWNLENNNEHVNYPIHVSDSGLKTSLDIDLLFNDDGSSYVCNGLTGGFKVLLTTPGDSLKLSRNNFRVTLSEYSLITITPKMITTSDGLKSCDPNQRQCFYQSERPLRYFKIYSKANCEAECMAYLTAEDIGCVKFSLPSMNSVEIPFANF